MMIQTIKSERRKKEGGDNKGTKVLVDEPLRDKWAAAQDCREL